MVDIEGPPCIYMRIFLMNVIRSCGVCRDTTRGRRASVVLHTVTVVGQHSTRATGIGLPVPAQARSWPSQKCFPPMTGRRVRALAPERVKFTVILPVDRVMTDPTPGLCAYSVDFKKLSIHLEN